MSKNLLIVLGVFLAVVVVGVFLIGRPKTQAPAAGSPPATAVDIGNQEETDIREVSVDAGEYSYTPSSITLAKGEKVRLTLNNKGRMTHDLVVEELGIRTNIVSPGESAVVEFSVPDQGVLTYFCSVSNHRALGMEGKITIE